jgi:hypothetical protein
VTQSKVANDLSVPVDVGTLEVLEEATPLAHHLQKATPTVVVPWMRLEVASQVVDPIG